MFTGMIGYTYMVGASAVWIAFGLVLGDFLASLFVHRRFRAQAGACGSVSYTGLLATWHGREYRVLRGVAAVVTLVFLLTYAARS